MEQPTKAVKRALRELAAVAHSIAAGVIERDKVPPEVIEHCRCAIEFFAAALPGER